ncbi:MAG: DUF2283 domain-containing protein [Candidatus Electrothrix sp. MAN1_4]|nr:DUF2283 domain-containing protein [Candidatus Electrothrix sp. MAN1_4]
MTSRFFGCSKLEKNRLSKMRPLLSSPCHPRKMKLCGTHTVGPETARNTWIDYDEEADVLYLSFRKPQRANNTVEISEDVLLRKDDNEIVGITVMNASTQKDDIVCDFY